MTEKELIKKKNKPKATSAGAGQGKSSTFPTLARIVSSDGSRVIDIPKLPFNISQLTTYDHMRIAMEHAALATSCLEGLGSRMTPALADSHNLAPIRLNLEDLMNHLYYAIRLFDKKSESS